MGHIEDRWRSARTGKPTSRDGKGLRWRYRYTNPDGRERSESFARKADAEKFRAVVDADMLRGTYLDPDAGQITLRNYAEQWLARQQFDIVTREAVESRIRLHILPVLGGKRLGQLAAAPSVIEAWLSGVKLAPSSKAAVFTHLNTIMRAALIDGRVRLNPCQDPAIRVPKPAQRRVIPWTPTQRAAVRAALPEQLRAFIDAGCDLGLRQSELFALSAEEIEFLSRRVQVRQQVKVIAGRLWFAPPKGGKERTVPLAAPTALVLSAHLATFAAPVTLPWHEPDTRRHGKPRTATLMFVTPDGRAHHRNAFNAHVWHPARKIAGLAEGRENGCHAMRHTYASTLIARGVDVRTVAEYLGHADGGALVLRTYSHLMPDAEDRARRAIEQALQDAESVADGPETAYEGGRPV